MILNRTVVDWIVKDIDSGHSAQLSQPEALTKILVDLAIHFIELWSTYKDGNPSRHKIKRSFQQ